MSDIAGGVARFPRIRTRRTRSCFAVLGGSLKLTDRERADDAVEVSAIGAHGSALHVHPDCGAVLATEPEAEWRRTAALLRGEEPSRCSQVFREDKVEGMHLSQPARGGAEDRAHRLIRVDGPGGRIDDPDALGKRGCNGRRSHSVDDTRSAAERRASTVPEIGLR